MASPDGELVDASGRVASAADAAAVSVVADRASELSDAAKDAVGLHASALEDVAGDVPGHVEAFAIQFPPRSPANLQASVVAEWSDGGWDYQAVRYTRYLGLAPSRHVVYRWPGGDATVACEWVGWTARGVTTNGFSGVHVCRAKRPQAVSSMPCLSLRNDVIGGPNGFAFGSMTVFVDGVPTYTGAVTNGITSEVWEFDNGARIK